VTSFSPQKVRFHEPNYFAKLHFFGSSIGDTKNGTCVARSIEDRFMSENRKIFASRNDANSVQSRIDRWEPHVSELDPGATVHFSIHR
jgi:hypothetical protein